MSHAYRLELQICDDKRPDTALGVLLPVPPTTPDQELKRLTLDRSWAVAPCHTQDEAQSALFVTCPDRALKTPVTLEMSTCGRLVQEHFTDSAAADTGPGDDAQQLFSALCLGQTASEGDRLLRIIDCLSRKFRYRSGFDNQEPLTCDALTGNCFSINTAVIRLAQLARIKTAYYIGFFFEQRHPLLADDWHCWVSTLTTRGFESWDIAHHLKRGLQPISPALNPIPGIRFAMSVGHDLAFRLACGTVRVPRLCEPRWIFPDGRSRACRVQVTATPLPVVAHMPAPSTVTTM